MDLAGLKSRKESRIKLIARVEREVIISLINLEPNSIYKVQTSVYLCFWFCTWCGVFSHSQFISCSQAVTEQLFSSHLV